MKAPPSAFYSRVLLLALLAVAFRAGAATPVPLSAPPPAPLQLDEIVVSATRTERKIDETPGSIVVLPLAGDPIADFGSLVRRETLVAAPFRSYGADTFVPYQRGGYLGYNLRGIDGNRVLLQVDGVRAPDEFSLGGSEPTGRDYLETELLDRVEILQGSASALYGTDALGGVVTFTTKSPDSLLAATTRDFAAAYKFAYASVNAGRTHTATAAVRAGSWQALGVYARRDARQTENNGTVTPNPERLRSDSFLAKLVWSPSREHRVEFAAEHLDRRQSVEIDNAEGNQGAAGTITRVHTDGATERFRLAADYRFAPAAPLAVFDSFTAKLYTQDSVARDENQQVRTLPSARVRDTETAFHNDTVGAALAAQKSFAAAGARQRLAYGLETSRTSTAKTFVRLQTTTVALATDQPRMADTDTTRTGFYAQDEIEWTLAGERKLLLIPGARLDRFELTPENSPAYLATTDGQRAPGFRDTAFAPKIAALISLKPGLNAYVQFNHGYRYPSAEELTATFTNAAFGYKTIPNPALRPETSNSFEAGIKGRLASALTIRAAAFQNFYDDFIEQFALSGTADPAFPAGIFQTRNAAEAKIQGYDLSLALDGAALNSALAGWNATAAYGWSRGRLRNPGSAWRPLESVAPGKITASLGYAARRWGATLGLEHSAAKRASDLDPSTATTRFLAPRYTVLDLTAFWRIGERTALTIGLYNLGDKKFWRYHAVRGVAAASANQLERRTEPGFNTAASLSFRY